jgi:hypothetical protein
MRRPSIRKSSVTTVVGAAVVLAVATSGGAVAGGLVTSAKIKNNTIKSIDVRNGTLTGADIAPGTIPAPYGGTSAYSTFHDAAVSIQSQVGGVDPTVLTLNVPAGSYAINASTWLDNGGVPVLTRCTLAAGADNDLKRALLEATGGGASSAQTVALQVVHTFPAAGTAKLTCWSFGAATNANNTKITAVKVDHLSNVGG